MADVNGDGKVDVVVAGDDRVSVLLGNGDGTLQNGVSYDSGGNGSSSPQAYSVAVADVNGDGKPDIVVANAPGLIGVLLGNGDGTFARAVSYDSGGYGSYSVAVADVDGDGKPDIVVANLCVGFGDCDSSLVGVLLGNGDGTFGAAVTYGSSLYNVGSVAIADVDGDGQPDLLVTACADSACANEGVAVLLGNGDGTFGAAVINGSGLYNVASVAVADVNGDGKPDLLVTACSDSACANDVIGVLLGNGDGTFAAAMTYGSGGFGADSVAAADVNGDGKPDLVVSDFCNGTGDNCTNGVAGVLLGNGDGTFQTAVPYSSGGDQGNSVAVGDLNGDGKPDLVLATCYINLCPTNPEVGVLINSSLGTTTTALVSSLNSSKFGQSVTFTATVTAQPFFDEGPPTGTVTFYDGTSTLGSVNLTGNTAILGELVLTAGAHTVTASYAGDINMLGSTSVPLTQNVNRATTTTALISSVNPAAPNQPVTYTTTVTSQYGGAATGTVSFKDGNATTIVPVTGGSAVLAKTYSITSAHTVTATYSGDSNNSGSAGAALTQYVENFPVGTKTAVTSSGSPSFIGQAVVFTATITSTYGQIPDGETVTFFDNTTAIGTGITTRGVAKFRTSSLTPKTHTIAARYAGDATFKTSSSSEKQVVIFYPSTTTVTSSPNPSIQNQDVTLTATVSSSAPAGLIGTVTFKNGTTSLGTATLTAGGIATLTTKKLPAGTLNISATYSGDTQSAKSSGTTTQTVN